MALGARVARPWRRDVLHPGPRAERDKNGFISDWTWLGRLCATDVSDVLAQPAPGSARSPFTALPGDYLAAVARRRPPCTAGFVSRVSTRLPVFTWNRDPGSQWAITSSSRRDQLFTQVVDYAYTASPAYAVQPEHPSPAATIHRRDDSLLLGRHARTRRGRDDVRAEEPQPAGVRQAVDPADAARARLRVRRQQPAGVQLDAG